jgi:hypothetical protein
MVRDCPAGPRRPWAGGHSLPCARLPLPIRYSKLQQAVAGASGGKRQQQNSGRLTHACVGWERPVPSSSPAVWCGFLLRIHGASRCRSSRVQDALTRCMAICFQTGGPCFSRRRGARRSLSLRINGAAELMPHASPMWPPVGFFVVYGRDFRGRDRSSSTFGSTSPAQ